MNQIPKQKRIIHYDLLRILAAFSVIMLHASACFWYNTPVTDIHWLITNTYNALFRFGVSIFIMISGALFLEHSPRLDTKRLYLHSILRLLVIFILWSCIYGLLNYAGQGFTGVPVGTILRSMLYGRYHLWFLRSLIGIYMLLPILKIWVDNAQKRSIEYFLLLFVILQIGNETVSSLFTSSEITYITSLIRPDMVCGYLGYFILGYYIAHYGIPRKLHKYIYIAAIPSVICNIYLSARLSAYRGEPLATIDDSFGIFTFIIVTALFLFFQEIIGKHTFRVRTERIISELSRDTLGVYVMHIALLDFITPGNNSFLALHNIISIPLLAVFLYIVCSAAAAILRRIPLIGRYIC